MRPLVGTLMIASLCVSAPVAAAPPEGGATVRLELVDQDIAFSAGQNIRFDYRVTGDLSETQAILLEPIPVNDPDEQDEPVEPEEPTPRLVIQVTNYPPLISAIQVADLVGPDVDRNIFGWPLDGLEIVDARDLITIDSDGAGLTLDIPTDSQPSLADHLRFDEPGLHPVRIELILDVAGIRTVMATAGTVVEHRPNGSIATPPLNLSLMGAVAEPAIDASEAAIETAQADIVELTDFAGSVEPPLSLALPPQLLADLTATSDTQAEIADNLVDDELIVLPAVPLDVSSAAAVGRVDAFARQLVAGGDLLTTAVRSTPTRRDVWLATEPLSASGAQALRDLGTRFVVMPRDLYMATVSPKLPATDQFVEISLPDGGQLPLLVIDKLGLRLEQRERGPRFSPTTFSVRTLGQLILRGEQTPMVRRSRIVAASDLGPLDAELVDELERMAAATPSVRFTPASALTGVTDVQQDSDGDVVVQLPPEAGPSLSARIQLLEIAQASLASAGSMLADDDVRAAGWRAALDALISTAYSDSDVEAKVDELLAEGDVIKESIVPPQPFTFTLTGKNGEIELPITNSSNENVKVLVRLSSSKLLFPDGDIDVELEPGENRVVVPVEARANGTSVVEVELLTPLGEPLGEPVRLTSRVNALTGLGQVLTGGLVLVLLTWWVTHWRSRRRAALSDGAERHPSGTDSIAQP